MLKSKPGTLGCVLVWLIVATIAGACQGASADQNAYPQPPVTQALATLMAQGVPISDRTEYPAPIPGPLAAPSTIEASPNSASTQTSTPGAELPPPALAARYYLAGRLLLEVPQVRVIAWEPALWITPNLGCQVSSDFESQNPISGLRITLQANGEDYEVHSDQSGEQLCLAKPLESGERIPLAGDSGLEQTLQMAQLHLSSRLGFPLEEIIVSKNAAMQWQSSDLGCPPQTEGQTPPTAAERILGYQIILAYAHTAYEYHSGGDWLVYCGLSG